MARQKLSIITEHRGEGNKELNMSPHTPLWSKESEMWKDPNSQWLHVIFKGCVKAGEMAQSVKPLSCSHGDPEFDPQHPPASWGCKRLASHPIGASLGKQPGASHVRQLSNTSSPRKPPFCGCLQSKRIFILTQLCSEVFLFVSATVSMNGRGWTQEMAFLYCGHCLNILPFLGTYLFVLPLGLAELVF